MTKVGLERSDEVGRGVGAVETMMDGEEVSEDVGVWIWRRRRCRRTQ